MSALSIELYILNRVMVIDLYLAVDILHSKYIAHPLVGRTSPMTNTTVFAFRIVAGLQIYLLERTALIDTEDQIGAAFTL